MDTQQIVGIVLVFAGFLDAMTVYFILEPQLKDSPHKKTVLGAVVIGALLFFAAGTALLNRWIRLPL